MTSILIADDHQMVREGFKRILAGQLPDLFFGEVGSAPETLLRLRTETWNLLLLDIFMPGGGGLEVLQQVAADDPQLPVLVISSAPSEQLALRTLRAGAAGYLNKQAAAEELVQAVRTVLAGEQYLSSGMAKQLVRECTRPAHPLDQRLTDREFQVLQLIVTGKSQKEIAGELGLSPKTISTFHGRIFEKLHLRNTVELIHYALDHHLVESPPSPPSLTDPPGRGKASGV